MHSEETHTGDEARDEGEAHSDAEVSVGETLKDKETQNAAETPGTGELQDEAEATAGESESQPDKKAHSIVGIRFEPCGKVYCFKANGLGLRRGEHVVVESDLGISIGRVVVEDQALDDPGRELKPVLRRVTDDDLKKQRDNETLKQEALDFCNERIMARGLAMKLLGTEVTLDKRRIVFFFTADTRIDFRELVKDLAAKFRTRIELRQVGVRDAARITGGLGVCGRELCCRRFLTSFLPISIKMAKTQELALNTSKLSGICGRLMCCLGYEYEEKLKEMKKRSKEGPEEKLPEQEEPGKQVEETVVEESPVAPEPAKEGPATAEPAAAEKQEEVPGRRRRRRRRRRSGKRHDSESRKGEEQKAEAREKTTEAKPSTQMPAEATTHEAKPAGQKPEEGASNVKKPFRRKRRRRMKGKKKE